MSEPISRVAQHLREMSAQKHVSDIIDFLLKVKQGTAVKENPSEDSQKWCMKCFLSKSSSTVSTESVANGGQSAEVVAMRRELRKL